MHPVREMHMKDHVLAATVSFLVYPITDRDCVAHRPSTSRLYFDVGVDFTYSSYGDMDSVLGDARLHRPPRRFVRTSTLAGSSSPPPIGTPSPTSPTVASRYSV